MLSLHAHRTAKDEVQVQGIHRAHLELSDTEWNRATGGLHITGHLPTEQNSIMYPHYGKSRDH